MLVGDFICCPLNLASRETKSTFAHYGQKNLPQVYHNLVLQEMVAIRPKLIRLCQNVLYRLP